MLLSLLAQMVVSSASASQGTVQFLTDADNAPEGVSLFLEVVLNESPTGQLGHVVIQGNHYYMPAAALRELTFQLSQDDAWVRLDSIAGLEVTYDQLTQRIRLTAPLESLQLETRQLNRRGYESIRVDQGKGVLLNYDLFALDADGQDMQLNGVGEFRVFGDHGLVTHSFLGYSDPEQDMEPLLRLDSTWSYSDPDALTTLQVGDGITRNLAWSRAVRFGGIQWRKNFSLQPDLIVYPLPQFLGQAALPSSVELYVNGIQQYQSNVAPGPFEISALPNVNQLGQATLVVTDILGRQTTTSLPIYVSNQLLEPGLTDYSLELGYVRENYGVESYDYRPDLMGSATLRLGLTEYITMETHAESTAGASVGGVGSVIRLGELGILSTAAALSEHNDNTGGLYKLGYEWQSQMFGVTLDTTRADEDYRDVASMSGSPPARKTDRAFLNFRMKEYGSLTAGYVQLDSGLTGKSRFGSLFYGLSLNDRTNLFVTVTEDLDDSDNTSVYVGINYDWENMSASTSISRQGDLDRQSVQVSRPVPIDGGLGWRASFDHGQQDYWQLDAGYRADVVEIGAGISEFDGMQRRFASLGGAIVSMESSWHLSRRISDGFALVSSTGVPDVPVLLENRRIGRTDSQGYYLLTPLSSYQHNRISIDPGELPEDVYFGPIHREVVPADRSGAKADFGLKQRKAATVILSLHDGTLVPVGSRAYLNQSQAPSGFVGYDGLVYLQNLEEQNHIRIQLPGSHECQLSFEYAHVRGRVPTLGPLICAE